MNVGIGKTDIRLGSGNGRAVGKTRSAYRACRGTSRKNDKYIHIHIRRISFSLSSEVNERVKHVLLTMHVEEHLAADDKYKHTCLRRISFGLSSEVDEGAIGKICTAYRACRGPSRRG